MSKKSGESRNTETDEVGAVEQANAAVA
ncbi:MAG: hypothetical protein RJB26_2295, partial [Pseudomonadota bacterium]